MVGQSVVRLVVCSFRGPMVSLEASLLFRWANGQSGDQSVVGQLVGRSIGIGCGLVSDLPVLVQWWIRQAVLLVQAPVGLPLGGSGWMLD